VGEGGLLKPKRVTVVLVDVASQKCCRGEKREFDEPRSDRLSKGAVQNDGSDLEIVVGLQCSLLSLDES